jgi:hypothetical protein
MHTEKPLDTLDNAGEIPGESLSKTGIAERVQRFLQRINREAVRECTSRYEREDRENYRRDRVAQTALDRPVIEELEADLLRRKLVSAFPIPDEYNSVCRLIMELQGKAAQSAPVLRH